MATEDAPPKELRNALDGYEVGRAFNRSCPSCGQEYAPGDRLVVLAEHDGREWTDVSVVCADCSDRSLPTDTGDSAVERALVGINLVATPMKLVLDAETATLRDSTAASQRE